MNNTLQNGLKVLEIVTGAAQSFSNKEIAERLGLPYSHTCRLLKTLASTGYIEQTAPSRKYRVSLKILSLSNALLGSLPLKQAGHGPIFALSRKLQAQVFLSAFHRGRSIIIDTACDGNDRVDPLRTVGMIHHPFIMAGGKLCAAFAAPDEREAIEQDYAGSVSMERIRQWRTDLKTIRQSGFAIRTEDRLFAAAVPIRDHESIAGTVGVYHARNDHFSETTLEALATTAEAIRRELAIGSTQQGTHHEDI